MFDRLAVRINRLGQFDFKEDEELTIELIHLQSVECFCDQLLSALNLSLVEKFTGTLHE